jgi:citrate lyase subunit beta/citryl-CoA lyase
MNESPRARRSCHAVPASSEKFLLKAPELGADMYFLDLEDAVAIDAKEHARSLARRAISNGAWGDAVLCVRLNAWATDLTNADLEAIVTADTARLDEVMLPKVESVDDVQDLDIALSELETAVGLPVGHVGIAALIETATGVMNLEAIAGSSPRLTTLVLGPLDLAASLQMPPSASGDPADHFDYIFMRLLIAARSYGLSVIDGPFPAVKDLERLVGAATRTRSLGFDGKMTLHPGQIEIVNRIFSPSDVEVERATAIISALDAQDAAGALFLNGEMIDEASAKAARAIIARQKRA